MQQRVEIMKVLFRGADLVILDEPTAVLTDIEVEGLFDVMRSLTDEGKSIIFISHKMREVMRISDYVTVLRRGKSVKTVKVSDTTEQQLADLMIGQKFVESTYQKVTGASETVSYTHLEAVRRARDACDGAARVCNELLGHLGRGLHGLHELLGNVFAGHGWSFRRRCV